MKFLVLALCVCSASAASVKLATTTMAKSAATVPAASTAAQVVATPAVAAKTAPEAMVPVAAEASVPVAASPAAAVEDMVAVAAAPAAASEDMVAVAAAPAAEATKVRSDGAASVVRSDSNVTKDGFNYVYETDNGIVAQASGEKKMVGDVPIGAVRGSYSYTNPDGTISEVNYVADENGFQPQSALLPVAPPVPKAIARALKYIAEHLPAPTVSADLTTEKKE